MSEPLNDSELRGSLRHQIRAAARQLAEHGHAVRLRRAALGKRLQAALTSPGMLLFAGGAGFVIAQCTGRTDSAQDWKGPQASKWASTAGARKALSFALEMYGLAHAATTAMGAEPHQSRTQKSLPSA